MVELITKTGNQMLRIRIQDLDIMVLAVLNLIFGKQTCIHPNLQLIHVANKDISDVKELIVVTIVKEKDLKEFVIRMVVILILTEWEIILSLDLEPNLKLIQLNLSLW